MLANVKRDGVWKVETEVAEHNHGPSEDLSAHPTLRRMTDEQVNKVNEMCDDGRSPAETLEELRTLWPDIKVLTRDIYNARKKYKTQKELGEQGAGQSEEQQAFEDPNGVFPGPSTNGRWAWLEDGDEVLNKKSKRRRRTVAAPPTTANPALDPQLQTPTTSHTSHQPVSDAGQQLLNDFNQNHPQPAHTQPRYGGGYNSAPTTYPRPNGPADHFGPFQDLHDDANILPPYPNHQVTTTASRLRSQRQTAPTASMSAVAPTSDASTGGVPGGPKVQTGQMIARMGVLEKEVRDHSRMLEQILGAVKGRKGVL